MLEQQRAGGQSRIVFILVWAASVLAALGIGLAGLTKFVAPGHWHQLFIGWGYPRWFSLLVGAVEIAGGVVLLIPRLAFYGALVLAAVMLGAIGTLLIHPTAQFGIAMPIVYLILLIVIATARVRMRASPPVNISSKVDSTDTR
jgi:putative oxidoreductase